MSALGKRKMTGARNTNPFPMNRRKTGPFNALPPRRRLGTARGNLNRAIKSAIINLAEKKYTYTGFTTIQLYHNAGSPASGRILPAPMNLDGLAALPVQGVGTNQRIGDSILAQGIELKLLFGQKLDRKNVTFRVVITRSNVLPTALGDLFISASVNILTEFTDPERCVVYDKIHRRLVQPDLSGVGGADKELTFVDTIYLPFTQKVDFTTTGAVAPDRKQYNVYFFAYDSVGTLITDNIGYVQGCSRLMYRDP